MTSIASTIEALLRTLMDGTEVPEFRLAPPD